MGCGSPRRRCRQARLRNATPQVQHLLNLSETEIRWLYSKVSIPAAGCVLPDLDPAAAALELEEQL